MPPNEFALIQNLKSNLHCILGIMPRLITSGEAHFRGLVSGQHSFEETSQLAAVASRC